MKKVITLLTLMTILFSCGESKEKLIPEKTIEYSFHETSRSSVKLQGEILVNLVDNRLPTVEEMQKVAEKIITENNKLENYFFRFEVPFTKKRPEEKAENFRLYYNINKLNNEKFEVTPLYPQMTFYKITILEKYIKQLGINKISSITPINIGDKLEKIIEKLGNPSEDDNNCVIYYILNERNQMFGQLYLYYKNGIINEISFNSNNINLTDLEKEMIIEYVKGNKELNELQITSLEDIYPFFISTKDFLSRLNMAKMLLGEPQITADDLRIYENKNKFYIEIESGIENLVRYNFSSNKEEVKEVIIVSKGNKEENYDNFDWDIMRAYAFLDPDCNFMIERNNILEKLEFEYDEFISKKDYSKVLKRGKYKYTLLKNKNNIELKIESSIM